MKFKRFPNDREEDYQATSEEYRRQMTDRLQLAVVLAWGEITWEIAQEADEAGDEISLDIDSVMEAILAPGVLFNHGDDRPAVEWFLGLPYNRQLILTRDALEKFAVLNPQPEEKI